MIDIARAIQTWFMERNISTGSVTIIVNIASATVAARTVLEIGRDVDPDRYHNLLADWNEFTLHGIKFKIESPLNDSARNDDADIN